MTALALFADDFADHDLPVKPGRLAALIEDSLATAVMHAPCLAGARKRPTFGATSSSFDKPWTMKSRTGKSA